MLLLYENCDPYCKAFFRNFLLIFARLVKMIRNSVRSVVARDGLESGTGSSFPSTQVLLVWRRGAGVGQRGAALRFALGGAVSRAGLSVGNQRPPEIRA
jgi:hypothetical protein